MAQAGRRQAFTSGLCCIAQGFDSAFFETGVPMGSMGTWKLFAPMYVFQTDAEKVLRAQHIHRRPAQPGLPGRSV